MAEDYVDVRQLLPGWDEQTCWSCGGEWLQRSKVGETICPHCLMGQGDHSRRDQEEPTDYGELWYGDIPREEMLEQYAEMSKEMREGVLRLSVETPLVDDYPAVGRVLKEAES